MTDSVTGAFGAMVAVVIILLKTCALAEITRDRVWILALVAGWSRWGQVLSIATYPYLKIQGKGAFHRQGYPFAEPRLEPAPEPRPQALVEAL